MGLLVQAPREALNGYLRRHDFSRWIRDVYGDRTPAAEIHLLEDAYEQGRRHDINDALAQIIHDRYEGFTKGDEPYTCNMPQTAAPYHTACTSPRPPR
jgi:hypothetical protein